MRWQVPVDRLLEKLQDFIYQPKRNLRIMLGVTEFVGRTLSGAPRAASNVFQYPSERSSVSPRDRYPISWNH